MMEFFATQVLHLPVEYPEHLAILRDKGFIEIPGSTFSRDDTFDAQFRYRSALKGIVDAFTPSPCLGRIGKN